MGSQVIFIITSKGFSRPEIPDFLLPQPLVVSFLLDRPLILFGTRAPAVSHHCQSSGLHSASSASLPNRTPWPRLHKFLIGTGYIHIWIETLSHAIPRCQELIEEVEKQCWRMADEFKLSGCPASSAALQPSESAVNPQLSSNPRKLSTLILFRGSSLSNRNPSHF